MRLALKRGWKTTNSKKYGILSICVLFLLFGLIPMDWAQDTALSVDDAVKIALEKDPGVESANWDWLAAQAKADAAGLRMFPSLSLSASYQRLSDLPATSISLGGAPISLPPSLTNVFSFGVNLQYPIFAGFRIRETAAIAQLQTQNKLLAREMIKRSLIFEVRRAYWEALRAASNVNTLQKNLELTKLSSKLISDQVAVGTATQTELLTVNMRAQQAEIDLGDAVSLQKNAYLKLATLIGKNASNIGLAADSNAVMELFTLSTAPGEAVPKELSGTIDEKKLITRALDRRPETRLAACAVQTADHSARLAEAGLYPTVTITGNYTLADPNPRVAFQTDPALFTGTWALGIQLSYDLGGLPANLQESLAGNRSVTKSQRDALKQQNTVILDVQSCIISLLSARHDLELIKAMVKQAEENLRVMQRRFQAGSVTNVDVLGAQLALLKANFIVTNKEIDVAIASADLVRAIAMEDIN
jgi:outer membrane protein TolC